jgi:hypothetical protein
MKHFVQLVQSSGQQSGLTSATISIQSHLMAFAAEKSRLERRVINLQEFRNLPN